MSPQIEQLLSELDAFGEHLALDELVRRLEKLSCCADDVAEHVKFNDECYARNLMHTGPGYQALVLCWAPGQKSKIHDHRGSACAVLVLEGTATETVFLRGGDGMLVQQQTRRMTTGQVCGSWDADIHEIANDEPERLITIHVYAPPLHRAGIYSLESPEVGVWHDPNGAAAYAEAQAKAGA